MLYLIYGDKDFLINQEINKIKKNFDLNSISIHDLNMEPIQNVIDDAQTFSLFSNKKLIICHNSYPFTSSKESVSDELEKYLKNPNQNTTLIFEINQEKIDNRKKITKLIKENGKIIELNNNINTTKFIKEQFSSYNINQQEIEFLQKRVGNNINLLYNEIEKIKIYKDIDKTITQDDIINLTRKNIDTDIFKLIDYIVQNKKNKAIEIYYEMIKNNEEPIKIMILLANQFRIMYQSKGLLKKGLSEKDIANILKIHPYRVKLALQNSRVYESKTLLKLLSDLAQIDYNIKIGKITSALALELFILKN